MRLIQTQKGKFGLIIGETRPKKEAESYSFSSVPRALLSLALKCLLFDHAVFD